MTSTYKINLYLASKDNNIFLQKIVQFLPHDLYTTDIVNVINFHWEMNLKYIIFYNLLYFFYGVLIVINLEIDLYSEHTEYARMMIKLNMIYAMFLFSLELL